MADTN